MMNENIAEGNHPLEKFLDTPVALIYMLKDGTMNIMTNGAWTWYSKGETKGTIHELGNHSFTYGVAEEIKTMSIIFLPPTHLSVCDLLYFGSHHGDKVDKLGETGFYRKLHFNENHHIVHDTFPTWVLKPIDVHPVRDLFKIVSTEFVAQHNGYPRERIVDEDGKFYRLVKEEIL
jgi:hypothetical protein